MNSLHPTRAGFLAAFVGVALALSSCTAGPVPDEDPTGVPTGATGGMSGETPGGTVQGPTPTASTSSAWVLDDELSDTALKTFSGTWEDVDYAFDLPSGWAVVDDSPGSGSVYVINSESVRVADLSILVAWGAECPPDNCGERPVTYLGDWAGGAPLSKSGPFVVRSIAMDLSAFPQDRDRNEWATNVQMITSLSSVTGPPSPTMVPRYMYGLGQVETGVEAANGATGRTVLFTSVRSFTTLREALDYAGSDEHRKIQALIASFREQNS